MQWSPRHRPSRQDFLHLATATRNVMVHSGLDRPGTRSSSECRSAVFNDMAGVWIRLADWILFNRVIGCCALCIEGCGGRCYMGFMRCLRERMAADDTDDWGVKSATKTNDEELVLPAAPILSSPPSDEGLSFQYTINLSSCSRNCALRTSDHENGADQFTQKPAPLPIPPDKWIHAFAQDGFVAVRQPVLSLSSVESLNDRLEHVLRGIYDRKGAPDKSPRILRSPMPTRLTTALVACNTQSSETKRGKASGSVSPGYLGDSGNRQNVKVLQVINVHKCDNLFHELVCHPALGCLVAHLAGWQKVGARVAQVRTICLSRQLVPLGLNPPHGMLHVFLEHRIKFGPNHQGILPHCRFIAIRRISCLIHPMW
jgi:hypothetical protein